MKCNGYYYSKGRVLLTKTPAHYKRQATLEEVVKIKQEQLISATEAADLLNISRNAVNELIKRAMLPALKVGNRYVLKMDAIEMYRKSEAWKRGQEQKERINQATKED